MEFLKGYLTQFNAESQVSVYARMNSKKSVDEKNKNDLQSLNMQKQSIVNQMGEEYFNNAVDNYISDNRNLESILYKEEILKFNFNIALNILWSILTLHSIGYVHNDFHANNVFLYLKLLNNNKNEDDVIIIDFGKTQQIKEKQKKMANDYRLRDYIKKYNLRELFANTKALIFLNYHAPYVLDSDIKDNTSLEQNALIESENESKYKNLIAFLIGNLIIENNPKNFPDKFKRKFNLIINLIEYYDKNFNNPNEEELTIMLLSGPKGKNSFNIVDKEFSNKENFSQHLQDLHSEYLSKRPEINEQTFNSPMISKETNYDAEDSFNQSESTADMKSFTDMNTTTGGKTTLFNNNFQPILTNISTMPTKNNVSKNKSNNKKIQQFMHEIKKRHIDVDFMKTDYQIPVWKPKNKSQVKTTSKKNTKKRSRKTKSKNKTRSVKTTK